MLLSTYKGPGIYGIFCLPTGKVYIGSSLVICRRLRAHCSDLRRGVHENPYLQLAWNKYGEEQFRFHLLEECSVDNCISRELCWIDVLETMDRKFGYNIAMAGASAMFGRKHSAKSIAKMKESHKGQDNSVATAAAAKVTRGKPRSAAVKAKIAAGNKGKVVSEETKQKIRDNHWSRRKDAKDIAERAASKNRGKSHTEEHKRKIGESHWSHREDSDEISARVSQSLKDAALKKRRESEDTATDDS